MNNLWSKEWVVQHKSINPDPKLLTMELQDNEKVILTSDDGSITLTNHRVVQASEGVNTEIRLEDFVSYENVHKRLDYYKILSLIFAIPAILLFFMYTSTSGSFDNSQNREDTASVAQIVMIILFVLTIISLLLLFNMHEKYLKITGRYSIIVFSIKNLSNPSLNKFINKILIDNERRKSY